MTDTLTATLSSSSPDKMDVTAAAVTEEEIGTTGADNSNQNTNNTSTHWIIQSLQTSPPPDPLPTGWIVRACRSQPNCYYYYHQETGISQWALPEEEQQQEAAEDSTAALAAAEALTTALSKQQQEQQEKRAVSSAPDTAAADKTLADITTATTTATATADDVSTIAAVVTKKRPSLDTIDASTVSQKSSSNKRSKNEPKEVRVLHLLKKHKDSRRPSSWRNPTIMTTKEEAIAELQEFLTILQDSSTKEEMRATFEELARTESDCSSAKRGGDLGFFGKRKMQPAFEKAAFALEVGELTQSIVETSSGVHILLRIG